MASLTPSLNTVERGKTGRLRKQERKERIDRQIVKGGVWLGWKEEEAISRLRPVRGASILC